MCARVCHAGHDITYSRFSRFFCDCGAGKGGAGGCHALAPRQLSPAGAARAPAPAAPAAAASRTASGEAAGAAGGAGGAEADEVDVSTLLAEAERLPAQLPRHVREAMLQRLRAPKVRRRLPTPAVVGVAVFPRGYCKRLYIFSLRFPSRSPHSTTASRPRPQHGRAASAPRWPRSAQTPRRCPPLLLAQNFCKALVSITALQKIPCVCCQCTCILSPHPSQLLPFR